MLKKMILFLIVVALFSCDSPKFDGELIMNPPINDSNSDGFWEIGEVTDYISEEVLREHIQLCINTGASSQLVIHKGRIISEWYSEKYSEPVGAMSSTKVIASLGIGILADRGKLKYSDLYNSFVPEWKGGYRDRVTLEQLLTHSSGIKRRISKEDSIGFTSLNKTEFALGVTPDLKPGSKFSYSNEGTQLLEPIIDRLSENGTEDFFAKNLFSKIGMNNSQFYNYGGSPWLYAELRTTTRDLARIGLLMDRGGKWDDSQVVSKEYIKRATVPSENSSKMGFLWWLFDDPDLPGYYASGYLNNDIYVFPKWDIVIVRTQDPQNGYSGKNESGNYFKVAKRLFKRLKK